MADDPGVMGNLPRSRPGRRSEKRAGGTAKATGGSRSKPAGARSKAAAKPRAASGKSGAASKPRGAGKRAASKPRATGARARAASKPRAASGSRTARKARAPEERAPRTPVTEERVEERQGQDPISAALRLGMAVGDAGLKAVAKVIERLPRP